MEKYTQRYRFFTHRFQLSPLLRPISFQKLHHFRSPGYSLSQIKNAVEKE